MSDRAGTSQASLRFHVGWWSQNRRANEPDQLDLKLSSTSLNGGEQLRGRITAPFNGKATVMVITDRVHYLRHLNLKNGVADFKIKVDKDWGTGAYLMATAFRATGDNKAEEVHLPVRATGFSWFDIGHSARRLGVELVTPDTVLPRKTAVIPVKITGLAKGEKARVTLLAVDEGILRLVAFKSPSLAHHFMGKRALGVRIHDLYGRLLLGEKGRRGTLSTGGDMTDRLEMAMSFGMLRAAKVKDNRAGLTTRSRRAVALVTRDVVVGADGRAEITLDMPDFVGQLRLMAVAYSAEKMGQASAPLIVRDPIATDLILPRFMAPQDQARPVITIQNLSGKEQKLSLKLMTTGPVKAQVQGPDIITLADGERREIPVLVTATGVGTAAFKLVLKGAKTPIERNWQLAVRSPYGFESRSIGRMLAAGESVKVMPDGSKVLGKGFVQGESLASVLLSNGLDLKVDKMLSDLALYRYMCTEQLVSRAMPMLYADRLVMAGLSDRDPNSYAAEIDQAIERLLMRQNRGGDFGLWNAYDAGNAWASLYAIDFLLLAKDMGYHVPEEALNRAFEWIMSHRTTQRDSQKNPALVSYGLYLRARAGDVSRGDVRHYAVTTQKQAYTPMAAAHLGAALAFVGEKDLAETYFQKSLSTEWRYEYNKSFYDYGSPLRDRAAAITLLAESGLAPDLVFEAGSELERLTAEQRWFNTQQKSWLVRAASVLSGNQALSLSVNGAKIANLKSSWGQDIVKDMTVTNNGDKAVRFVETLRGLPAEAPTVVANGIRIKRRYLDLKGNEVDLNEIDQNDRFIVLITGESKRIGTEASLVLDLLPAGLEIENASVGGDSQLWQYKFLPRLSHARYSSELDDRYFAVLDNRHKGRFAFAYMVRAVTPGTYVLPPVMVEDMYEPQYRAVGKAGMVTVHGVDEGTDEGTMK
ncbi:MAG: hypothetical protein JKY45_08290 [Emcibacter sp.]|nr:hypothetical protein [Emcibacter sp.]